MEYGAVGLILYVAPFVVVMMALLRYRAPKHHRSDDKQIKLNRMVGVTWACLAAYLVVIMTVSGVTYIVHFGYILLGLAMGVVKVGAALTVDMRKDAAASSKPS
jgi:heme/copper-type cytochrome/quinol oxidase subunit 2